MLACTAWFCMMRTKRGETFLRWDKDEEARGRKREHATDLDLGDLRLEGGRDGPILRELLGKVDNKLPELDIGIFRGCCRQRVSEYRDANERAGRGRESEGRTHLAEGGCEGESKHEGGELGREKASLLAGWPGKCVLGRNRETGVRGREVSERRERRARTLGPVVIRAEAHDLGAIPWASCL